MVAGTIEAMASYAAHDIYQPLPVLKDDAQRNLFCQQNLPKIRMGYLRSGEIIKRNFNFGSVNPRALVEDHVGGIMTSLVNTGVMKLDNESPLPIVASPTYIAIDATTIPFMILDDFKDHPELKWSAVGQQLLEERKIECLGGRHRSEACFRLARDLPQKIKDLKKRKTEGIKGEVERLERCQANIQEWLYAVYNLGEPSFT